MDNKEVFLYRILLGVTLTPLEVTMQVVKTKAIERVNSYLITHIEFDEGKMQPAPGKIITKANIMAIYPSHGFCRFSYSTFCLEHQISEAKALCMQEMEHELHIDVDNAILMREEFKQWKSNLTKS